MSLPGESKLAVVFGGSGFVGRYVVRELARRGYRVRAAVRRPDLAGHLQTIGVVGQVHAVQANLRYPASVQAAVAGADFVVNCVGILFESGRQRFSAVQAEGARAVALAAKEAGASSLVHISAIGADENGDAEYAHTKAQGERFVLQEFPEAVILRPSIVFGPEDDFFNRFAAMAGMAPALPLVGGGTTKFQPVFVGDVADAVGAGADGKAKPGTIYELGGPRIESFKELLQRMMEETRRRRLLLPLPKSIAKLMGRLTGWLPKPPITVDQVKLLARDNIVSDAAIADGRTLAALGIDATPMETVLPSYLVRFRKGGQFAVIPKEG